MFAARRKQAQDKYDHVLRVNRGCSTLAKKKYDQRLRGALRDATRDYQSQEQAFESGFAGASRSFGAGVLWSRGGVNSQPPRRSKMPFPEERLHQGHQQALRPRRLQAGRAAGGRAIAVGTAIYTVPTL